MTKKTDTNMSPLELRAAANEAVARWKAVQEKWRATPTRSVVRDPQTAQQRLDVHLAYIAGLEREQEESAALVEARAAVERAELAEGDELAGRCSSEQIHAAVVAMAQEEADLVAALALLRAEQPAKLAALFSARAECGARRSAAGEPGLRPLMLAQANPTFGHFPSLADHARHLAGQLGPERPTSNAARIAASEEREIELRAAIEKEMQDAEHERRRRANSAVEFAKNFGPVYNQGGVTAEQRKLADAHRARSAAK